MSESERLLAMGFSTFFRQQLAADTESPEAAWRVIGVQRNGLRLGGLHGERHVSLDGHWRDLPAEERPTVGDWLLLDGERVVRLLERKSLFRRMASGTKIDVQLIGANVDTAFVVSSCNADFNPSRLERYLAWALEARVDAVLLLTKADLAADPEYYRDAARRVRRDLAIELVNACDTTTLDGVRAWCRPGQTLALLGSSGVGKSTLVNTLAGARQSTQAIREDDARGRHTTTDRSLHALPGGAWLLDSPGIRALALAPAEAGTQALFEDLDALARRCRFADCAHQGEPDCAVADAVATGALDQRRLANYQKLLREEARVQETLAERHRRVRAFSKRVRESVRHKNRRQPP